MYFYELHEGDNDVFADLLLARDEEMEPEVFLQTVQAVRENVIGSFEHDTLIEAIADELERDYEFVVIADDRLTAAVNVSQIEKDNFLAELEAESEDDRENEDRSDEDDEDQVDEEVRTLLVDLDRNPDLPTH